MAHTPQTGGAAAKTDTFSLGQRSSPIDPGIGSFNKGQLDDFLFGVAPSAVFEQMPLLTGGQNKLLNELLAGLSPQTGEPIDRFGGDLVAGLSNLEQTSLAGLEQNALDRASGATPTQQLATKTLEGLLSGAPTDFQDFFKSSVEDPALKTFEERILPSIGAKQAKNFFSTERLTQEDRAREDLQQSLNATRGEFAFATQESAQNRKLQALGLVDQVTGAPIDQAIKLLAAGQVPREIEQAGLTAEYTEFLRVQDEKAKRIEQIIKALNVQGVENFGISLGGQEGAVSSFLGGGGGGAIAGLFSSREFKEDIKTMDDEEILSALEGLDIAKWNYKGFDTKHIGPIAEEFQEAFGVGDGKTISVIDIMGVTLASQKAVAKRVDRALGVLAEAA